mgnify:CR=1 FL=1
MTAKIINLSARRSAVEEETFEEESEASVLMELHRARIRIAQLERDLLQAIRDSVAHYDRARDAERRLAELGVRKAR